MEVGIRIYQFDSHSQKKAFSRQFPELPGLGPVDNQRSLVRYNSCRSSPRSAGTQRTTHDVFSVQMVDITFSEFQDFELTPRHTRPLGQRRAKTSLLVKRMLHGKCALGVGWQNSNRRQFGQKGVLGKLGVLGTVSPSKDLHNHVLSKIK